MSNRRNQRAARKEIEWNFVSFPSFVAFVSGMFFTALLISLDLGGFVGGLHTLVWYVALIGVSFSLAHVFTRTLRSRREEKARERETEEERERRAFTARARAAQAEASAEGEARPRGRRRRRR